ncbi:MULTISPECIES: hypothetical protein [Dyadobacter]|uniref:Uncharacterized protein n=1 Tax=Dyadobacter chenhuakuii TaxID=2909339 RepID=A0ABY4XTD4_9BACT|nr:MULTISPECIES: hypothetical protein [Dyadobacter]MCF2492199.1 hypothetical protein [Dyadobacter chenhuakuii]MCF2516841.1 hypothetical protein [Dyadobacter sp. CY351]USJ33493.1 hypothetical protein NFI80_12240 [Dyadobacter chenhuakuii]
MPPAFAGNIALLPIFHASGILLPILRVATMGSGVALRMSLHASGIKIQYSHIHCYQYYMPLAFAGDIASLPLLHASGICYQYCVATMGSRVALRMSLHASGIKIQHSHIHCYQYYMPPAFAGNVTSLPIFYTSGICWQYCVATNISCLWHLLAILRRYLYFMPLAFAAILRRYQYFMPLAFITNIASLPIFHASGICWQYYVATYILCLWHLLRYYVATNISCLWHLLPILRRYRYFMPPAFVTNIASLPIFHASGIVTNIASLRDLALLPANAGGM